MLVIGLMSGTSLDGVDAAVLETDGETIQHFGPSLTIPYRAELRASLKDIIQKQKTGGAVPLGDRRIRR